MSLSLSARFQEQTQGRSEIRDSADKTLPHPDYPKVGYYTVVSSQILRYCNVFSARKRKHRKDTNTPYLWNQSILSWNFPLHTNNFTGSPSIHASILNFQLVNVRFINSSAFFGCFPSPSHNKSHSNLR